MGDKVDGDKVEILQAINQLGTEMGRVLAELRAGQAKLEADVIDIKADILSFRHDTDRRLICVEARLDEQRQTVNALIPTKIATAAEAEFLIMGQWN